MLLAAIVIVSNASLSPLQAQGVIVAPQLDGRLQLDFHNVTIDVEDQIATTTVDLQLTNTGEGLAEGQYLFSAAGGCRCRIAGDVH